MTKSTPRVAFLLYAMYGGGIERVMLTLFKELIKYPIAIDLVLIEKAGNLLSEVPPEVRIIELPGAKNYGRLRRVLPLMRYLRQEKPTVLLAHFTQYNVIAPIAKLLARTPLRIILVEHLGFAPLEDHHSNNPNERVGLVNFLRRVFYRRADVVAAVSQGLAQQLDAHLRFKPGHVQVLYNPVVDETLLLKAQASLDHPWFQSGQPPVFLGVGRLMPQKDFSTLIQAFAIFRQKQQARLVILGEGDERQKLQDEIKELNLEEDVSLPGFTDNPYAYMSRASAFVLSSQFEAFGLVVAEALACGCQVISTDCPYGPNEILQSGKYGHLVPVGNPQALADAMEKATKDVVDPDKLRLRAEDFSLEKATSKYLELMKLK